MSNACPLQRTALRSPLQVLLRHRIAKGDAAKRAQSLFCYAGQDLDHLAGDVSVDVFVVGLGFMRDENARPGVDRLTKRPAQPFERARLERECLAVAVNAAMNDQRSLSLHGRSSHDGKYAVEGGASQRVRAVVEGGRP